MYESVQTNYIAADDYDDNHVQPHQSVSIDIEIDIYRVGEK